MKVLHTIWLWDKRLSYTDSQDMGQRGATTSAKSEPTDDEVWVARRGSKCKYSAQKWNRNGRWQGGTARRQHLGFQSPTKEAEFDLGCACETFMKAKKRFAKAFASGSKDKPEPEMDPSMLTTFLETCMKLLCNSKAMKGLQELINRCASTAPGELHIVRKIDEHKTRTGWEIRLTAQIGEYEMIRLFWT